MQCWHITMTSTTRLPLFADEAARREAVRHLVRVVGGRLVLFSFADEHGHLVVVIEEDELGQIKTTIVRSMGPLVASPIAPLHVRPVEHRGHLTRLVGYFLGQTTHHELPEHPARWSGSCFPDLVGARCIDGAPLRIRELLPQLRPASILAQVGLPADMAAGASDRALRVAGASRIVCAASAATAARPDLSGRSDPVCAARRAAVALADQVGIARSETSWALDLTPGAVRRIAARPVDERALRAARIQIAIEDFCAQSRIVPPAGTR
jgi:hypothetical protein